MSDTLEGDDMIVLVVGDEGSLKKGHIGNVKINKIISTKNEQQVQEPDPITFKEEPEEEDTKTEYYIEYLDNENIKGEDEDPYEYLEEHSVEYKPEKLDDDQDTEQYDTDKDYNINNSQDDDSSDSEYKAPAKMTLRKRNPQGKVLSKRKRKKRTQKKTQNKTQPYKRKVAKIVSFVQKLRRENPEMADDEQMLVEHMAVLMRETVPPEPPKNHCTKVRTEEGVCKYECTFCGYRTDTEAAAARHYQYKHGECYLICYACGQPHKTTPNLYKHEKRCRAPDVPLVLRARAHYLGRKGRGRPFASTSKFVTKNTFVKQKENAGPYIRRRYFCTKCPASFVHRDNLQAHEFSHEGLRPYRCHHCPASYASYAQYKRHMALHGDYQYICDHCGRKFKLKSALISHLDTHQPRKHPCLYCERRFAGKSAWQHHMNTVHLDLPAAHGCPVCPKRYAKMSHVKEHMARKHNLTMITAKMFFRAMPNLSDEEVRRVTKLFNFTDVSKNSTIHDQEPEHILPDSEEATPVAKYIKIIKKRADEDKYTDPETDRESGDTDHELEETNCEPREVDHELEEANCESREVDHESEDLDHELEETNCEPSEVDHEPEDFDHEPSETNELDDSVYPVEYLEEFEELEEELVVEKKQLKKKQSKNKRKQPQPNKVTEPSTKKKTQPKRVRTGTAMKRKQPQPKKITQPSVKIDEEIDVDLCNIEYKRKRKSINPAPEKKNDDEMYKIVRDIKSTITTRNKVTNNRAEKKKSTQNFYELKREFMNQLKNEIEIPESDEGQTKNPRKESIEKVVPGTEIPENFVSWTNKTEKGNRNTSQKIKTDDDDEEWKVYKNATEKNKVVVDFLEYVKSGVVPKHVPILRRGRETKKK